MLRAVLNRVFGEGRPPDVEPHVAAASRHLQEGRHDEAINIATAVLDAAGPHAEAQFIIGTAHLEGGDAAAAVEWLARSAALRPHDPRCLYNLAVAHWQLGNMAEALGLCRDIVSRQDFRPAHLLIAYIELEGENYFRVLERLHAYLRPETYVEVGVATGLSFALARPETWCIGIDPEPRVSEDLGPRKRIFTLRSDDFFASHDVVAELGGRTIDMAFIDGMHHFEYALRDFANIERASRRDSVILIHDCWPLDRRTAERERSTEFWTGDVWRLVALLRKHRPDLTVRTIGAPPTGLGIVLNLDPSSTFIAENHDRLVEEMLAVDYAFLEDDRREKLGFLRNDWDAIRSLLDSRNGAAPR